MHTHPPDIVNRIGKPIGRIPSGVFILTASDGGASTAMLASWVQQAAFDPPAISVAVAKGRPILDLIRASNRLAISVVSQDDKTLMKRYARGIKEGEDAFSGVATLTTASGLPVLADALAWLEGEILSTCDFGGDHELLIARVTDGAILRDGASFTHQRGNGFHY